MKTCEDTDKTGSIGGTGGAAVTILFEVGLQLPDSESPQFKESTSLLISGRNNKNNIVRSWSQVQQYHLV